MPLTLGGSRSLQIPRAAGQCGMLRVVGKRNESLPTRKLLEDTSNVILGYMAAIPGKLLGCVNHQRMGMYLGEGWLLKLNTLKNVLKHCKGHTMLRGPNNAKGYTV